MTRQIVLDTETTGLSAAAGDRIIEIGCVELINRKPTGNNLHLYLNPERDSHEDALKVHGISNEFLRDKPRFAEVVDDILAYLEGAELIIHNADFDLGFLNKELERLGRGPIDAYIGGVIDTLRLAKQQFPGKRNSLDALCERLGVDNARRTLHGALLDAELLAEIYIGLTRGQEALPIEAEEARLAGPVVAGIDFSRLELPVIEPSETERAAHLAVLAELDKASGGRTVWKGSGATFAEQDVREPMA